MKTFTELGYNVSYGIFNTFNFNVPQNRLRVIIIGYATSFKEFFEPPKFARQSLNLKNSIYDLRKTAVPA